MHQVFIMCTLSIISLMVALDACIIVTALNAIIVDLELSTSGGIWIGTSYLLANAVTMPLLSELSNIFGRPIVLVVSLCCFMVGTLMCCLAQGLALLLSGRVIQGIGGAGIMSLSLVIFTDMVPLRWRPKWYGFVLGAWAMGNCAGPVVGGAIALETTWRWIFYLMFPLCIIGLVLVIWLLKFRAPVATGSEKVRRVDWIGGICFIISASLLLVAISWGGSQFSWSSPGTLSPLCLGFAGLLATLLFETKIASRPFLRRRLFRTTSSVITYICGTIQGFLIYGQLYYIPFYFQSVKGFTALETGVAILPVMVTCIPSSMITGIIVTRSGNYRWAIWIGWAVLLIGSALTIILDENTPTPIWATILVIIGLGHGAILNAQNFASQAMCDPGEEGAAAAMYAFVRQFGMALGVGVGGSIFQNTMANKLRWEGLDTSIASQSEALVSIIWGLPSNDYTRSQALDAYTYGLHSVYLFFSCISAVALALSLFSKHYHMREEVDSEHILEGMSFEL
ncbi:major facilitator superfamily transporter [Coniella lustricola]|uniref:Major facilitator superfamily transporter n=1 Tax=Coniella lustricola TaxID=2025994 RepID=A0A2T3A7P6_9PEZI|nr:major facilitator superfamily transporter [Coniella lustricola]